MIALVTNLTVYTSSGTPPELNRKLADANVAVDKALLNLQAIVSENSALVVHAD